MAELVTLATFDRAHEAHLVKGVLEGSGILCFLENEHLVSISYYPAAMTGGIRLRVCAQDAEKAVEILRQHFG